MLAKLRLCRAPGEVTTISSLPFRSLPHSIALIWPLNFTVRRAPPQRSLLSRWIFPAFDFAIGKIPLSFPPFPWNSRVKTRLETSFGEAQARVFNGTAAGTLFWWPTGRFSPEMKSWPSIRDLKAKKERYSYGINFAKETLGCFHIQPGCFHIQPAIQYILPKLHLLSTERVNNLAMFKICFLVFTKMPLIL